MALVNLLQMVVLDNPASFQNPFQFEITFECLQELQDDLEWKVLYVGSANDPKQDQILDEVLVGPVPVGVNKFILQADAPQITQLPKDEIIGVTVLLVTCSYREKEFVRVGYYVNNEYLGEYDPEIGPPIYPQLDISLIQRQILADKPRVTRFPIVWGNNTDSTTTTTTTTDTMIALDTTTTAAIASSSSSDNRMSMMMGMDTINSISTSTNSNDMNPFLASSSSLSYGMMDSLAQLQNHQQEQ